MRYVYICINTNISIDVSITVNMKYEYKYIIYCTLIHVYVCLYYIYSYMCICVYTAIHLHSITCPELYIDRVEQWLATCVVSASQMTLNDVGTFDWAPGVLQQRAFCHEFCQSRLGLGGVSSGFDISVWVDIAPSRSKVLGT